MTTQEIEEIKEDICDNYCKYPTEYEDNEILEMVCNRCPLNKLEGDELGDYPDMIPNQFDNMTGSMNL